MTQSRLLPPQPQPYQPQSNGLGVAAMVLGIIAAVFAFIPIINQFALILGGVAVILGIIGLTRKGRPHGTAIAGLVLGVVSIVIAAIVIQATIAALNSVRDAMNPGATNASSSGASPASTSDYQVTIDKATFVDDFSAKPAVIVDLTFANHSAEKTTSFMVEIYCQAFQNGVELDRATVSDPAYDVNAGMKDVKPGASAKAQQVWSLTDKSTLSVECNQSFSLDRTPIATKEFEVK